MSRKVWIVAFLILAIGVFSLAYLLPSIRAQADSPAYILTITSDRPDPSLVNQRVTVYATLKNADGTPAQCATIRVTNGFNTCTLMYNRNPTFCSTALYPYCYLTFPAKGEYVITATFMTFGIYTDTKPHTVVKH